MITSVQHFQPNVANKWQIQKQTTNGVMIEETPAKKTELRRPKPV